VWGENENGVDFMAQPRESSRETTQEADSRHDSIISQEDGDSNDSLKMARAEQAIAKKQTETPEFKRFFGDWDAAAKVKPATKPSLLVQNQ
jgi:hypothetical protein